MGRKVINRQAKGYDLYSWALCSSYKPFLMLGQGSGRAKNKVDPEHPISGILLTFCHFFSILFDSCILFPISGRFFALLGGVSLKIKYMLWNWCGIVVIIKINYAIFLRKHLQCGIDGNLIWLRYWEFRMNIFFKLDPQKDHVRNNVFTGIPEHVAIAENHHQCCTFYLWETQ